MLKFFARRNVKSWAKRYDYDAAYMEAMLDADLGAFVKFSMITAPALHEGPAAADAYFAAKIQGALVEDCGPCTQLVVNMAREAGVANDVIAAVLEDRLDDAGADAALGARFAKAVFAHDLEADAYREEIVKRWGEKGLIAITMGMSIGRVFPTVKRGLGYAHACHRIDVGGRDVAVVKAA